MTSTAGVASRHSFSFGRHYDPDDTGHGLLRAHNEDVLQPGSGYGTHPHVDTEVVTWVLAGVLTHADSTGARGTVRPGVVQRMSAGRGVTHSEWNDDAEREVHLVQAWVAPGATGLAPSYEERDVGDALSGGGLVVVASGRPQHADGPGVRLHAPGAALHVARMGIGEAVELPEAPALHLFVARGDVELDATALSAGDAVRLRGGGQQVTATGPAEVLVWEMHEEEQRCG